MYTMDMRMYTELSTTIHQGEFLATVGFYVNAQPSTSKSPQIHTPEDFKWVLTQEGQCLKVFCTATWPHLLEICHNASSTMST